MTVFFIAYFFYMVVFIMPINPQLGQLGFLGHGWLEFPQKNQKQHLSVCVSTIPGRLVSMSSDL